MSAPATLYAVVWNSEALIEALDARRQELGMSMIELDAAAGMAPGSIGKYLGPGRTKGLGAISIFKIASGLGLRLAIEIDPDATAAVLEERRPRRANQSRPNNHASPVSKRILARANRHFSKIGNRHRWKRVPKDERSSHARMMALKRHHPTYSWEAIKRAVKNVT